MKIDIVRAEPTPPPVVKVVIEMDAREAVALRDLLACSTCSALFHLYDRLSDELPVQMQCK